MSAGPAPLPALLLPALGPWASYFLSQSLNFLSCKMGCQDSMIFALEVLGVVP